MSHHHRLESIWESLHAATIQRTGFTLATLATVTAAGQPRTRAVIVRDFSPNPDRICFATDARSAKVSEMRAHPQVALAFYDETNAVQLRAEGRPHVIDDPAERQRAWKTLAPHSRELYETAAGPGSRLDAAEDDGSTTSERFAWVSIRLDRLDWLDLATDPHQRWLFQREDATWTGHRVVP